MSIKFGDVLEQRWRDQFEAQYGLNADDMFNDKYTEKRRAIRKCVTMDDLYIMRRFLSIYGIDKYRDELVEQGVLNSDYSIATDKNIFAKFVSGMVSPWYGDMHDSDKFFLARNLKQNDDYVYNTSKTWLGKASMSETHFFVVPRNLKDWTLMNGLVLGINDPQSALNLLNEMREYGKQHIANDAEPGFYLHITPFSSIPLLHLHVLDMKKLGPSFEELSFKNLPLDAFIAVLEKELLEKESASL